MGTAGGGSRTSEFSHWTCKIGATFAADKDGNDRNLNDPWELENSNE